MRFATTTATLLCALGLAAGSAAAQNRPMPGMPMSGPTASLPPVTMAKGESPDQMFTAGKIAAVASASNFGEIDPSQLALTMGQSQAVKDFAREMVSAHTQLERQMREMLSAKKVAVEDNALSLQLKRNGPPTLDMLRSKMGAEFDKAYVLQQIESHDMTLMTLDTSLIPSAKDPEMKAMLRDTVRPAVVQHLQRIKQIHDSMAMAAR